MIVGMTNVDWAIVALAGLMALGGLRRGLLATVLSLVGLVAGGVIGSREAPHLLHGSATAHYAALVGLGGAVVGALVLQAVGGLVGGMMRAGLRLAPPLRLLDSVGGLAAGAATGLALAWIAGAALTHLPGPASWQRQARQSHVLRRLDELAPPSDVLKLRASLLERLP